MCVLIKRECERERASNKDPAKQKWRRNVGNVSAMKGERCTLSNRLRFLFCLRLFSLLADGAYWFSERKRELLTRFNLIKVQIQTIQKFYQLKCARTSPIYIYIFFTILIVPLCAYTNTLARIQMMWQNRKERNLRRGIWTSFNWHSAYYVSLFSICVRVCEWERLCEPYCRVVNIKNKKQKTNIKFSMCEPATGMLRQKIISTKTMNLPFDKTAETSKCLCTKQIA